MLGGTLCMVTCPIDMHSVASVELSPGNGGIDAPADSPKARQAVQATLDFLGETGLQGRLDLDSALPRGKGMASSSADVSAAIYATALALGRELPYDSVADLALSIEPSDGVMLPGIAIFDHLEGRVSRSLGAPPPMRVVILDFGGTVDTRDFNSVDREDLLGRLQPRMEEAASLIEDGILRGDPLRIGRGSTISAVANQQVLFNPNLDAVLDLSIRVGALGVNVAHSGTVIGLLFPDQHDMAGKAAAIAHRELPGLKTALHRRIIGGGVSRG